MTGEPSPYSPDEPGVLDRVSTPRGELVLRRLGPDLEIVSNGVFLMDTRDGRSERALVREAVATRGAARDLLVGGLGVGFSLLEAVAHPGLLRIDVVEIEPAIVGWHATHLADRTAAALADERVHVAVDDVGAHLAAHPAGYDVVCLDVDNGPDWTVSAANTGLYGSGGLATCLAALRPGGVLAVWSAHAAPDYLARLESRLEEVRVVEVAARVERGEPDLVYLGRLRPG